MIPKKCKNFQTRTFQNCQRLTNSHLCHWQMIAMKWRKKSFRSHKLSSLHSSAIRVGIKWPQNWTFEVVLMSLLARNTIQLLKKPRHATKGIIIYCLHFLEYSCVSWHCQLVWEKTINKICLNLFCILGFYCVSWHTLYESCRYLN